MKQKFVLKKNSEFKRLIDHKVFVINDSFTIYVKANTLGYSRFGISVGKKQGNAVVRNKLKRQIRMMVDDTFENSKSLDYVIMVRKDYANKTYAQNLEAMKKLDIKIKKRGVL